MERLYTDAGSRNSGRLPEAQLTVIGEATLTESLWTPMAVRRNVALQLLPRPAQGPPPSSSSARTLTAGPPGAGTRIAFRPAMPLSGKLEDLPVADLLHFLHAGLRTGTLRLSRGEDRAQLCFLRGRILAASLPGTRRIGEAPSAEGALAAPVHERLARIFAELLGWSQGDFLFVIDRIADVDELALDLRSITPRIAIHTEALLLEAARLRDEARRLPRRPARPARPSDALRTPVSSLRVDAPGGVRAPASRRRSRLPAPDYRPTGGAARADMT
jgi:hypothetical protein